MQAMPIRAEGLSSKFLEFIHEVAPVAMSAIGAILVNHYSLQPTSHSIIVQAPAPP
jgi:hypothetical protein